MNRFFTKIIVLLGFSTIFLACNATKRVPNNKLLLTKNEVFVNGKPIKNDTIYANIAQKPNQKFMGSFPFYLHLYNSAKVDENGKPLNKGLSKFLKNNGEPPVIISKKKALKTTKRLKKIYFNKGFFNSDVNYKIDTLGHKKGKVIYSVTTKKAYTINAFSKIVQSPVLDSLYEQNGDNSYIKTNKKYSRYDLEKERARLANIFSNNGIYQFLPEYIKFEGDSIDQFHHLTLQMKIQNKPVKKNGTIQTEPFEISKINSINIYTDHTYKQAKQTYFKKANYQGVNFYAHNKLNYKPKALANLITIKNNQIFKEQEKRITYDQLYRLNNFKTISINYVPVKNDTTNLLDVNIYLTPDKPFKLGFETEIINSNLKNAGLSGLLNFSNRNIFKGAETLTFGVSTTVSSSIDRSENDPFFNVLEVGGNLALNIPRILFFTKTKKWIPSHMFPKTRIFTGINYQKNIGLDKQDFNTSIQYSWASKATNYVLNALDVQYIKNIRPEQFFHIYQNTFESLSSTAVNYPNSAPFINGDGKLDINQTTAYIDTALNDPTWPTNSAEIKAYNSIKSIQERQNRLTQNNLILGTSISFIKNNQEDINDNNFSFFKIKLEGAGNMLQILSSVSGRSKNGTNQYELLGIPFSHYIKSEFEYRKHWALTPKQVVAFRFFSGVAFPLGNANGNIPFSKSYFGGGTSFNRAWEAYKLGPGTTDQIFDFNEANMKLEFNIEYRFGMFGNLSGAFFADAGNIWMTNDNLGEAAKFQGISSLKDIALGTGFGLRYNIRDLFIIRADFGYKTYDPSKTGSDRWAKSIRIDSFNTNVGINYPF